MRVSIPHTPKFKGTDAGQFNSVEEAERQISCYQIDIEDLKKQDGDHENQIEDAEFEVDELHHRIDEILTYKEGA